MDGAVIATSTVYPMATSLMSFEDIRGFGRSLECETAELAAKHDNTSQAGRIAASSHAVAVATAQSDTVGDDVMFHQAIAPARHNALMRLTKCFLEGMMRIVFAAG